MTRNVLRFNEPIMVPSIVDANGTPLGGSSGASLEEPFVAVDGSASIASSDWSIKRNRLTLTNVAVALTSGSLGTGVALVTNPAGGVKLVLGAAMTLTVTVDGSFAGTEVFEFALGTLANNNSSLATTEENVLASDDVGRTGAGSYSANSTNESNTNQITPVLELLGGDTIYLNVTESAAVTGTITVSGTVDIFYVELD